MCCRDRCRRLLLADGDDRHARFRAMCTLCCASDALDDMCQVLRDFSHALPIALGYTVNLLFIALVQIGLGSARGVLWPRSILRNYSHLPSRTTPRICTCRPVSRRSFALTATSSESTCHH